MRWRYICTTKARKIECERERKKQKKIVCCFVSSPSLDSWLCTLRHHTTTIKRTNKSCAAKNNEKLFEIFLIILLNCLRWRYPSFDQSVVGSSDATAAWNTHKHTHKLTKGAPVNWLNQPFRSRCRYLSHNYYACISNMQFSIAIIIIITWKYAACAAIVAIAFAVFQLMAPSPPFTMQWKYRAAPPS